MSQKRHRRKAIDDMSMQARLKAQAEKERKEKEGAESEGAPESTVETQPPGTDDEDAKAE